MKDPPQFSAYAYDPRQPVRYKEGPVDVKIKTSRDQATFDSYNNSSLAIRAIKYCSKMCVNERGEYDKENMQICVNNYKTVVEMYSQNYSWYHQKVDDMKRRGEVPAILQDQIYDDKSY